MTLAENVRGDEAALRPQESARVLIALASSITTDYSIDKNSYFLFPESSIVLLLPSELIAILWANR